MNVEFSNLVMKLTLSEPIAEEDVRDWINADEQQEITDAMIVNFVNKENDSSMMMKSVMMKIDI